MARRKKAKAVEEPQGSGWWSQVGKEWLGPYDTAELMEKALGHELSWVRKRTDTETPLFEGQA